MTEKRKVIKVYPENRDRKDTLTKLLLKYIELKKQVKSESANGSK